MGIVDRGGLEAQAKSSDHRGSPRAPARRQADQLGDSDLAAARRAEPGSAVSARFRSEAVTPDLLRRRARGDDAVAQMGDAGSLDGPHLLELEARAGEVVEQALAGA